jgi:hypothetical protein
MFIHVPAAASAVPAVLDSGAVPVPKLNWALSRQSKSESNPFVDTALAQGQGPRRNGGEDEAGPVLFDFRWFAG